MRRVLLILCLIPLCATAQGVGEFEVAAQDTSPSGSVRLPQMPFDPDRPPATRVGQITRQALQRAGSSLTSQQIIEPFSESFESDGFEEVFSCADRACGGFDFRFQLDLLPEPEMHVDLGDFRYVLMERGQEAVSLVASRSATTAFLQITRVSEEEALDTMGETVTIPEVLPQSTTQVGLIGSLEATGHVILEDVEFESGSASLTAADYPSLSTLAAWLTDTPSARIALVGHTDAVGALDGNVALSTRRASAVRDHLIDVLGADAGQLQAQGAGYLSPRASNLTEEGRALNRRVEAVLLSRD